MRRLPDTELEVMKALWELEGRPAARAELEALRAGEGPLPDPDALSAAVLRRALRAMTPGLGRVVNATGVVLHTNLGRAPLSPRAAAAVGDFIR